MVRSKCRKKCDIDAPVILSRRCGWSSLEVQ